MTSAKPPPRKLDRNSLAIERISFRIKLPELWDDGNGTECPVADAASVAADITARITAWGRRRATDASIAGPGATASAAGRGGGPPAGPGSEFWLE